MFFFVTDADIISFLDYICNSRLYRFFSDIYFAPHEVDPSIDSTKKEEEPEKNVAIENIQNHPNDDDDYVDDDDDKEEDYYFNEADDIIDYDSMESSYISKFGFF